MVRGGSDCRDPLIKHVVDNHCKYYDIIISYSSKCILTLKKGQEGYV